MRGLTNEIENVKVLTDSAQDLEPDLYKQALEDAPNDLIILYLAHSETDSSLSRWQELLESFRDETWPARAAAVGISAGG